jgi:hypothetical protein
MNKKKIKNNSQKTCEIKINLVSLQYAIKHTTKNSSIMKTILLLSSIMFFFNSFSMVGDRGNKRSKGFNYSKHYRHVKMYKIKNKIFNFNKCKNVTHHN